MEQLIDALTPLFYLWLLLCVICTVGMIAGELIGLASYYSKDWIPSTIIAIFILFIIGGTFYAVAFGEKDHYPDLDRQEYTDSERGDMRGFR